MEHCIIYIKQVQVNMGHLDGKSEKNEFYRNDNETKLQVDCNTLHRGYINTVYVHVLAQAT